MIVTLKLDENIVGQIVDGLQQRADAYAFTERFYTDSSAGEFLDGDTTIEEVSDVDEARNLKELYLRIISDIQLQLMGARISHDICNLPEGCRPDGIR